jgi:hypothetical protein
MKSPNRQIETQCKVFLSFVEAQYDLRTKPLQIGISWD